MGVLSWVVGWAFRVLLREAHVSMRWMHGIEWVEHSDN